MADLKMKSNKYIFKKKLSLRRKSKKRLFVESAFMFICSLFLVSVNYLIPNKKLLIQNIPNTLNKFFILIFDLFISLYEILLVIFIFFSSIFALILLIGSFYRIFRIFRRKAGLKNYE